MSFKGKFEKEILNYLLQYFQDPSFRVKKNDLFNLLNLKNNDNYDFKLSIKNLLNRNFIEEVPPNHFTIRLDGAIYYEINYLEPHQYRYIRIITLIFDLFHKIEKGEYGPQKRQVSFIELLQILQNKGLSTNEEELYQIFRNLRKSPYCNITYAGIGIPKRVRFYSGTGLILTNNGRKFLEYHQSLQNLFQNISNSYGKRLILEEYLDILELWKREKWKDIAIKIGSILEYCIDDYFDWKSIKLPKGTKNDFYNKISHIMQKQIVGDPNDWLFVRNNIREYRNFVHIQNLVKNNITFNKTMIEQIHPYFEKLIKLF